MFLESTFIYHPVKYPEGPWDLEAQVFADDTPKVEVEDVEMMTYDHVKIHAWYAPHPEAGKRTLLWLHGNAGNIAHRYHRLCLWSQLLKLNIMILDYRGYGKSEGKPDENGLHTDAVTAWNHLMSKRGISADDLIIQGNSLGGAVAVRLAKRIRPAGLILNATFTSIPAMANQMLPIKLPSWLIEFFMTHQMNSLAMMPSLKCPVLIAHGELDQTIPHAMGQALASATPILWEFLSVPDADHDNLYYAGESYHHKLKAFTDFAFQNT